MNPDPKITATELEFSFDPPPRIAAAPAEAQNPPATPPPVPDEREEEPHAEQNTPAGPGDQAEEQEMSTDPEDSAEEYLEDQEEGLEEEPEEEVQPDLGGAIEEIRDELAAASTENRRNTKRIFDALKQFGGVLDALSATVNTIHSTSRSQAAPPPRTSSSGLELIELADRIDRIAAAFAREPAPARSWWPPARRALDAWHSDRALLADSFSMLVSHVRSLLKNAGLERIPAEGGIFDPSCMNAVEAVFDTSVKDHTVLAELLPGWREAGGGRVIRSAQVRVSRSQ
jgi:molecular chaperone GrpE (heat shock protein)